VWLHGEAVGCGMVMAPRLSMRLGLVNSDFLQRITTLVERAGLPVQAPVLDASDNGARYLSLMRMDKKSESGEIKFVLIDGHGQAMVRGAPDTVVSEVIAASCGL
jgi:3-dehydroquinate synthase